MKMSERERTENWLDITGVDLGELVRGAYDLSIPAGLGDLHYTPGGLSDDEVEVILGNCLGVGYNHLAVALDYVKGRGCKMNVFKGEGEEEGRLYIERNWFDHTDKQLIELLKRVNVCTPLAPYEMSWKSIVRLKESWWTIHPLAHKEAGILDCPVCNIRISDPGYKPDFLS